MSDVIPHVIAITQGDTELAPVHQCNVGIIPNIVIRAYGKELV